MRREVPPGRAVPSELPPDDLPSPEVLDELLRAFSADAADEETLEGIDLASPEVAELIAPTASPPPPANPEPHVEVDADAAVVERAVELQGEGEGEGETSVPPGPDEDHVDPGAGVSPTSTETTPSSDPPELVAAPDVVDDDDLTAGESGAAGGGAARATAPTGDAGASSPTTRTVVIDASDDPPDAVYLAAGDPLLNAPASRGLGPAPVDPVPPADTTVFIDDQAVEAGETISIADASSATRIEPRLRERRIAVRRAVGRKRLRWVFLAAAVLVVVVAALAVLGSSLFAIEEVRVDGAVHTDAARLQAVVEELEGTPVLRADTDAAERELASIPWVDSARVTTQFPHGATIELRERAAVATYRGPDQRFRVIDLDGRVLEVVDDQPADQVLIESPDVADLEPGQFSAQGFIAAANLVQALTPEARALAANVTVTGNGGDLRMILTDGREVRFGPGRDLVVKLVRLQTKLQEPDAPGFQYLDVSTDDVTTG